MSEHTEQVALFNMLLYHPDLWVVFAVPNGGLRNKRTAINLKHEGVKAGIWDIFVPIPANGYHGMYVEMKFGKNKLTAEQMQFGKAMIEYGYRCKVAYSAEEAYTEIMEYLGRKEYYSE